MEIDDLDSLATEASNLDLPDLSQLSTLEMVKAIHAEDSSIPGVVAQALPEIARAIDAIAGTLSRGGRLIYMGAGTSGRLGSLDASEWFPTFGVPKGTVVALVAGGHRALYEPVEGAEDLPQNGERDLRAIGLTPQDCLVGITASGRTPYVLGGMQFAQQLGALTIGLSCNQPSKISQFAAIQITLPTGPEVLSGSTRMKAGTATKMVLNMLSTGVMVRLGKTYANLMVDVQATNAKLRQRAIRLVQQVAGVGYPEAEHALRLCNWEVKTAVLVCRLGCSPEDARERIDTSRGRLSVALEEA